MFLEISGDAQSLEGILGFVIHGTTGALGCSRGFKFGNDFVDRSRLRRHRERDVCIAELDITRTSERAGRAMDHEAEDAFERLRVSGYL